MRFLLRGLRAAFTWLFGWPAPKPPNGTEAGRRSLPMPKAGKSGGLRWPVLRELPLDEPPRPAPRSLDQSGIAPGIATAAPDVTRIAA